MKIEFFKGANNESGVTQLTVNRREAAFIKVGVALLYAEACKAKGIFPSPFIDGMIASVPEIFKDAPYDPDVFARMISDLEMDGKAWLTFLDPKFDLQPKPTYPEEP